MKRNVITFFVFLYVLLCTSQMWGQWNKKSKEWYEQVFYSPITSVEQAKRIIDSKDQLSELEGIWRLENNISVLIERNPVNGIVPETIKYRIVLLNPPGKKLGQWWDYPGNTGKRWKKGTIVGFIEPTAIRHKYKFIELYNFNDIQYLSSTAVFNFQRFTIQMYKKQNKLFDYLTREYPQPKEGVHSGKEKAPGSWEGSGYALTTDGYIATCDHVVDGARHLYVMGINGDYTQRYKAIVVTTDKESDIAIIRIKDFRFPGIDRVNYHFRNTEALEGESCFALGFPISDRLGYTIKVTEGIISATNHNLDFYQMSVPVTYGSSGGPVFDRNGMLIGHTSAGSGVFTAANFASKSTVLLKMAKSVGLNLPVDKINNDTTLILPQLVSKRKINTYLILADNIRDESDEEDEVRSSQIPSITSSNVVPKEETVWQKLEVGKYDEVDAIVDSVLRQDSKNSEMLYLRGLCRAARGRVSEALFAYNEAAKQYKNSDKMSLSDILREKAKVEASLEMYDMAEKDIISAIDLDKEDVRLYAVWGYINYYKKDYRLAVEKLSQAISIAQEKDADMYYYRALCWYNLQEMSKACADMGMAAGLGDKEAEKWMNENCNH